MKRATILINTFGITGLALIVWSAYLVAPAFGYFVAGVQLFGLACIGVHILEEHKRKGKK